MRKTHIYGIRLHPEIYVAFKLLCDRTGYKRLNEAVEWIMLRCIEEGRLPIHPKGDRVTEAIRRVHLLKAVTDIRKKLARKVEKKKAYE